MDKGLLTPAEVAEKLRIKRSTVLYFLRTGKITGVKVGDLWRVTEEDLEEFIQKNKRIEGQ